MLYFKFNIIHFYIRFPLFNIFFAFAFAISNPPFKVSSFLHLFKFYNKIPFRNGIFFQSFLTPPMTKREKERQKEWKEWKTAADLFQTIFSKVSRKRKFFVRLRLLCFSQVDSIYTSTWYILSKLSETNFFSFLNEKAKCLFSLFLWPQNEAFKILSSFAYSHSSLLCKQTYQITRYSGISKLWFRLKTFHKSSSMQTDCLDNLCRIAFSKTSFV